MTHIQLNYSNLQSCSIQCAAESLNLPYTFPFSNVDTDDSDFSEFFFKKEINHSREYSSITLYKIKDTLSKNISYFFQLSECLKHNKEILHHAILNGIWRFENWNIKEYIPFLSRDILLDAVIHQPDICRIYSKLDKNVFRWIAYYLKIFDPSKNIKIDHAYSFSEERIRMQLVSSAEYQKLDLSLNIDQNTVEEFSSWINNANFQQILKYQGDYSYIALQAFEQQKISSYQFSSLLLLQSLKKTYPVTVINVFDERGKINPEAIDAILQTFYFELQDETEGNFLSLDQFHKFLELLSKAPKSEQCFYSFPESPYNHSSTLIGLITQTLNINIFCFFKDNQNQDRRMVSSFTMKQLFLQVLNPKNPVQIIPKIGVSTYEEIEANGLEDTRDSAVPFANIELPKIADNFLVPNDWDFNHHDFYHAFSCSYVPVNHRHIFINIAKKISKIVDDNKNLEQRTTIFLNNIAEQLVDMDFGIYKSLKGEKLEPIVSLIASIDRKFTLVLSDLESDEDGSSIEIIRNIRKEKIFESLSSKILYELYIYYSESEVRSAVRLLCQGKTTLPYNINLYISKILKEFFYIK